MPQWCLPSSPSCAGGAGWNSADILIYSSAVPWRLIIPWLFLLSFHRITCWRRWRRRGAESCPHSFTFNEISLQHLPSALQHHSQHVGSPSPPPPLVLAPPFPIHVSKDREGCTHSHPTEKTPSLIYLFGIYCSCVASQGNVYWMHFILFND